MTMLLPQTDHSWHWPRTWELGLRCVRRCNPTPTATPMLKPIPILVNTRTTPSLIALPLPCSCGKAVSFDGQTMINFLCNFSAVVLLRSSVGDMEKHINHLPNFPSGSCKGFSVEKLKHAANWGAAIWPDHTLPQVAGHLTSGQGGPSSRAASAQANKFPEKVASGSSFQFWG